jgi:phosphatidylglycerol---prolipoprotein diacylglyceryl transferase
MTTISGGIASGPPAYPRFFRILGHWINSYKVFLCVGIYAGILVSAAVGQRSGLSPLRLGVGLLFLAVVGMLGARLYHLATHARAYRGTGFNVTARDRAEGGWSVLGGLLVVPASLVVEPLLGIPFGVFWDHMAIAIAVGGMWIRFGCVCNGCCVGRDSHRWYALRQHDVHGETRRRVPAQWLEIGWWGLACVGLVWLWPLPLPAGSYALLVLGWYGLGRFWLEPLRRHSARLYGFRVNQAVAALLAIAAAAGLLWRTL